MKHNKRILIIDHDVSMRMLVSIALGRAGYDVFEAATSDRCGTTEMQADLVVLDVNQPPRTMAGDYIAGMRKRFPHIPFIAVSGYFPRHARASVALAEQLGVERTLPKPFKGEALIKLVAELIEKPVNRAEG